MARRAAVIVAGLVVVTIVCVVWLGPVGLAIGVLGALLIVVGDALAGSGHGSSFFLAAHDPARFRRWPKIGRGRDAYSDEVDYDEEAWARVRERRAKKDR